MIKRICKILMVVFMVVGICITISNLLSVELNAKIVSESYDFDLDDCMGPPGSCWFDFDP
jgi:hypothetical protein